MAAIQNKLTTHFNPVSNRSADGDSVGVRDTKTFHFDVNTVDKFQGRDMDVAIISMVKNKNDVNMGDLLRDWRRVNVAVSR